MKSVNKLVKKKIQKSQNKNKIWSYNDFQDLPRSAVAKALSNLHKQKIIARHKRGLYYIPKETILGKVSPNIESIAIAMARKKSSFVCVSGLSGYNKIGLTTQVPNVITIACDYSIRNTDRIRFILRNKPSSGTEIERIILDAIRDIQSIPDTTPVETIYKIKNIINNGNVSINDLGKSALKEPPIVKAVVGALGQELNMDKKILMKLKNNINPNTVCYLDIIDSLKFASNWRIKPRLVKN